MKFAIIGLIVLFTLLFIACALIFPELVGIAGKKAKKIEESHKAPEVEDDKVEEN